MGKRLFIAEKPSVATSFAQVLGIQMQRSDRANGYVENSNDVITWCFGHLVTLAFPDAYHSKYKEWKIDHLPIIPDNYIYTVIDDSGVKKQFQTIKSLFHRNDIDEVFVCTDSGREGEYIFRLVYHHADCTIKARRVWISSQTEEAILDGIKNAKDISEYDLLSKSAYSRAKEDWLFGMNFSRIYTLQYGWKLGEFLNEKKQTLIPIGRVMTCVLGLVVDRELEIRNFVPKKHFGISGEFFSEKSNINYSAKWQPSNTGTAEGDEAQYISKKDAEDVMEKIKDKPGVIRLVESKSKLEQPPFLFNLAELQSEATKKFKIPVEKTLEIAQELYEKKLITYPRTDCKVLPTDVVNELPKILNGLFKVDRFRDTTQKIKDMGKLRVDKKNKRFVDDSKVTDHYAIIPTYVSPNFASFSAETINIYTLIVNRFLASFFPPAKYATLKVETEVASEIFVTTSRVLKESGWKEVYDISAKNSEDEQNSLIHKLKKGEACKAVEYKLEEKETKPPIRYTDGSLVLTMEKAGKFIEDEELREKIKTCGIGTSATRAGIIKKLKDIGHIQANAKTQILTPTKKGESIVEIVRKTAKELLSPSLSASWEKGLVMLEQGETTESVFNEKLSNYINKTINKVKSSKHVFSHL